MPQEQKSHTTRLAFDLLAGLIVVLILLYFAWRFLQVYIGNLAAESGSIAALIRYFAGTLVELLFVWAVAQANFRLIFLPVYTPSAPISRIWYWVWISLLALLWFMLLEWRTGHEPEYADENVLLTLMISGFIIAYAYIAEYFRTRHLQLALLKDKSIAELNVLKAQIKPHFLFNTLNVLYNSAQKQDDESTAQLIHELSQLLRFSIQEASAEYTDLHQELNFLERYIHFQTLRLPAKAPIDLQVNINKNHSELKIAPLLLIPFVENAFQYGISLNEACFLHLTIEVENQQLSMRVQNSIMSNVMSKK
jgi:sensor histidine kinase YesM